MSTSGVASFPLIKTVVIFINEKRRRNLMKFIDQLTQDSDTELHFLLFYFILWYFFIQKNTFRPNPRLKLLARLCVHENEHSQAQTKNTNSLRKSWRKSKSSTGERILHQHKNEVKLTFPTRAFMIVTILILMFVPIPTISFRWCVHTKSLLDALLNFDKVLSIKVSSTESSSNASKRLLDDVKHC